MRPEVVVNADQAVPEVSIIVINWNTRDLLQQALETLWPAVAGLSVETIVVDNGSHDGSAELVRERWPEVHLIALPHNVGFAAGNNAGIAMARGRKIMLLNSDVIVLPSTVRGLSECLDRHHEAGCVGARHLNEDLSLQRSMDRFPTLFSDFLSYSELSRLKVFERFLTRYYPWWGDHDQERRVGWVNGACLMVRREVLEAVGGLDESFFIYGEELDWCYRMAEAGWETVFTPEAEVVHLCGQAMDAASSTRIVLLYLGQLKFYAKHYAPWKVASLRMILAILALLRLIALSVLLLASRAGVRPSDDLWRTVTGERVRTGWKPMFVAWMRIARLQPDNEIHAA